MLSHYTHNFITITNQTEGGASHLQASRKQLGTSTQLEGRLSSRANRRVIKGAASSSHNQPTAVVTQSMRTSMERTLSNGINGVTAEEETKPTIQLPQISGTKSTLQHQSGSSMGGNSVASNPRKLDSVARQSHESEQVLAKNSGEDAGHYLVRKNKLRNARLSQLDDAMQFNMTAKNVINPALEGKNNNSDDLEQALYK